MFLLILVSGVVCVREHASRGAKWTHGHVSLPPVGEEACSARGGRGRGFVPDAGPPVAAVILPNASEQLHQVTTFTTHPPLHPPRVRILTVVFVAFFPQTLERVHRGLWENVAVLLARHQAEPEAGGRRPGSSERHAERAGKEAAAPRGGDHR